MTSGSRQRGFTYVLALVVVLVVGLGLAATGEFWSQKRKREKEVELIWAGNQISQAIGRYYERSPGGWRRYPDTLDDLLDDRRHPGVQRYLRMRYADPMTGHPDWQLVPAPEGGFRGVRSRSDGRPLTRWRGIAARTYGDWEFVYTPPDTVAPGR